MLREVQAAFAMALLRDDEAALLDLIEPGIGASQRIAVHRNTVLVSLVDALASTFPAVERLVDARFFAYAATEFVRVAPPAEPCLAAYGAEFPAFLSAFPPCRELPYLADVARLEWLLHRTALAEEAMPVDASALAAFASEQAGDLIFRLHPALGFTASPWPIDRIWQANRRGATGEAPIDLAEGEVRLEVARLGADVLLRPLDPAVFAFRHRLATGATLEGAAEGALAIDADFPLAQALSDLFAEGAVIAVALAPSTLDQEKTQ